jgi:SHS2 domain-containing protein
MEKYETFSTTADVGIRIQGNGYEGLFHSAVKGLNLVLFGEYGQDTHRDSDCHLHFFEFHGDSCENTLVNLLAEILYLLQVKNKMTIDITIKEVNETYLKADLITAPLEREPDIEIKSVTYHNLQVKDRNGIKSAEVIFDV